MNSPMQCCITLIAVSLFLSSYGCGGTPPDGDSSLQEMVSALEAQAVYDPEEGDIHAELRVRIEHAPRYDEQLRQQYNRRASRDPDAPLSEEVMERLRRQRGVDSHAVHYVRLQRLGDWQRVDQYQVPLGEEDSDEHVDWRPEYSFISHLGTPQRHFRVDHGNRNIQCNLSSGFTGLAIHFQQLARGERIILEQLTSNRRIASLVAKTPTQATVEIHPNTKAIIAEQRGSLSFWERVKMLLAPLTLDNEEVAGIVLFDLTDKIRPIRQWNLGPELQVRTEYSDYRRVEAVGKSLPHRFQNEIVESDGTLRLRTTVELLQLEIPVPAMSNLLDVFDEGYYFFRQDEELNAPHVRWPMTRDEALKNLPQE